jgi:hypothetical protein
MQVTTVGLDLGSEPSIAAPSINDCSAGLCCRSFWTPVAPMLKSSWHAVLHLAQHWNLVAPTRTCNLLNPSQRILAIQLRSTARSDRSLCQAEDG